MEDVRLMVAKFSKFVPANGEHGWWVNILRGRIRVSMSGAFIIIWLSNHPIGGKTRVG